MQNPNLFIYSFLLVQILFVAIHDIKHRKISNQWAIMNLIIFAGLLFFYPESYKLSLQTFFYSIVFFVVGFLGFLLRVIGAGDSKYLFTLFLLTPMAWHDQSFELLLVSTFIIGGFSFLTQATQNYEKIIAYSRSGYFTGIKQCLGNKFPYAPVILMSWIWLGVKVL